MWSAARKPLRLRRSKACAVRRSKVALWNWLYAAPQKLIICPTPVSHLPLSRVYAG